jgi:hypothetical protein
LSGRATKGGRGHDHGDDRVLHPAGDGFVAQKAKPLACLPPDPAPRRGIRGWLGRRFRGRRRCAGDRCRSPSRSPRA